MTEREMLTRKLAAADFSLYEMRLFLDTHPHDCEALNKFKEYRAKRDLIADEYQCKFGPLTSSANDSQQWDWIKNPWPWDYEEGIC